MRYLLFLSLLAAAAPATAQNHYRHFPRQHRLRGSPMNLRFPESPVLWHQQWVDYDLQKRRSEFEPERDQDAKFRLRVTNKRIVIGHRFAF